MKILTNSTKEITEKMEVWHTADGQVIRAAYRIKGSTQPLRLLREP